LWISILVDTGMTMARDCISSVILLGVSLSGSVGCFYGLWVVAGV